MGTSGNLFANLCPQSDVEQFEPLLQAAGVRIEKIVSTGQSTDWFDQDWDEWVLVVSGSAEILLAHETAPRRLRSGDYLFLPAHCRHRVTWTEPGQPTLWLAVHITGPAGGPVEPA